MSVPQVIYIINYYPNCLECTRHTASWIVKSQLDTESLTQLWNKGFKHFQKDNLTIRMLFDLFFNKYILSVLQEIKQSLSPLNIPSGSSKTNHSVSGNRVL